MSVEFGKYFPATIWLFRRLTSRVARRVALYFILVVALLGLGLRIYSAIFVHRVHTILAGMERLRPDQSTKAEVLKMVPALRPGLLKYEHCEGDECYAVQISNVETLIGNRLFRMVASPFTLKMMSRLGLHLWRFGAKVDIRKGRMHSFYYFLAVDDGSGEYPGAIDVDAGSLRGSNRRVRNLFRDESPDYQISSYFKWPELNLRVVFRPTASPLLIHHAFDLRLGCMLLLGCRTARQILPLVWDDMQNIRAAAISRVQSSDPCPNRILPRRARDIPNIFVAEVEHVHPGLETSYDQVYKVADFRVLEVLKGAPNLPLKGKGIGIRSTILGTYNVPSPAVGLLRPGGRVVMFTDTEGTLVDPCELVTATPSALQTLQSVLASPDTHIVETDLGLW